MTTDSTNDDTFSFDSALEWRLAGTPEMVKPVLRRIAEEFKVDGWPFSVQEKVSGLGRPGLEIGTTMWAGSQSAVGMLFLEAVPGGRTNMRVPPGAPGDARLFSAFLQEAERELRQSGFLASSSRFQSCAVLDTARRELDAAEDSTAFANIGNSCRAALKALANELYARHMLPDGQEEPKGDDAEAKLRYVARHYLAGRSDRYRGGLVKAIDGVIEGVWDMASPLVHRHETATREEAEATLALVAAMFQAFSFIVPS